MAGYLVISLFVVILAAITFYLVYYIINSPSSANDLVKTPISLSSPSSVLTSDLVNQQLLSTSGSTVMGLFNIQIADKTPQFKDTYSPLFGVPGSWTFEISPSKAKKTASAVQLRVTVATHNGIQDETIDLPDIPLQKWIFITILRDGRRFDIMYNDKIVASHRLTYYPAVLPSILQIGNNKLSGSAVHMFVYPQRLDVETVIGKRATLVDTNGAPKQGLLSLLSPGNIPDPFSVPPDIAPQVSTPPSNTMKAWSSPYA